MPAPAAPPPVAPQQPVPPVENKVEDADLALADKALDMALKGLDPSKQNLKVEEPKPDPVKKEEAPKEPEQKEEPKAPDEKVDPLDVPPDGTVVPKQTSKDLRSQLVLANKNIEKLTGEKKLVDEELTNLRKEVEELRKRPADVEPVEKVDYTKSPEVTKHTTAIHHDVEATARVIGGKEGKSLRSAFYKDYLPQFLKAASVEGIAGDELMDALRTKIEEDMGESGGRDTMALLNRSMPVYEQAMSELKKLEADTHNHSTRRSVEKYSSAEKEVSALLDPLGELPEEVLAAKPYAVESFVSKLISSDPKWLAQSHKVKAFIKDVFVGVKPLTPEERQKMEANNDGGLSQVEETRQKKHQEDRKAAMRRLYHSMMILPNLPALLEELEGLRAAQIQEDGELDALEKVPPVKEPSKNGHKEITVEDANKMVDDVFRGKAPVWSP